VSDDGSMVAMGTASLMADELRILSVKINLNYYLP
jgi:hypothetical protein